MAAAGILGFVALLVVGALVYFFLIKPDEGFTEPVNPESTVSDPVSPDPASNPTSPEPTTSESSASASASPESTPEDPQPDPSTEPVGDGSLDQYIQEQVGDYTLQEIQENPEAISNGATDARDMIYASSDGTQLFHGLVAWPSPEQADGHFQGFVEYATSELSYEVVDEFPLENEDGEQFGSVAVLQGETEIGAWTNGSLFAYVEGPEGRTADFFNEVQY